MTEDKTYDTIPAGWKRMAGTVTAHDGSFWINNGRSLFDKDYKQALCKEPQPLQD